MEENIKKIIEKERKATTETEQISCPSCFTLGIQLLSIKKTKGHVRLNLLCMSCSKLIHYDTAIPLSNKIKSIPRYLG